LRGKAKTEGKKQEEHLLMIRGGFFPPDAAFFLRNMEKGGEDLGKKSTFGGGREGVPTRGRKILIPERSFRVTVNH